MLLPLQSGAHVCSCASGWVLRVAGASSSPGGNSWVRIGDKAADGRLCPAVVLLTPLGPALVLVLRSGPADVLVLQVLDSTSDCDALALVRSYFTGDGEEDAERL